MLVGLPLVVSLLMTAGMYGKFTMIDGRPSGIRGDAIGPHRGLPEYVTRTVGPDWERYVQDGGFETECASKHAQCHEAGSARRTRRWRIDASQTTTLRLPVFAFPAWSLARDGAPLASAIDPATGLIAVELPAGRNEVSLTWAGLSSERTGLLFSVVSLGLLAALMVVERIARTDDTSQV
jgi:hypothetical protein